jgi:HSP20 family protein
MSTKSLTKSLMTPSLIDDFFKPWNEWFDGGVKWSKVLTVPAVNVTEKNNHYLVSLAAPGLGKEDFDIKIEGNMMTISSEREESQEEEEEKYTRKEYSYSSFSRSFTLPDDVKMDAVDARYEKGVLNITLPKMDAEKKQSPFKTVSVK